MRAVKVRTGSFAVGRSGDLKTAFVTRLSGACRRTRHRGLVVSALGPRHQRAPHARSGIDPRLDPLRLETSSQRSRSGAPATCAMAALVNHRQALGDTRTPMADRDRRQPRQCVGHVVRRSFYEYFGGLPRSGVAGSGFGTATAEWLESRPSPSSHAMGAGGPPPHVPAKAPAGGAHHRHPDGVALRRRAPRLYRLRGHLGEHRGRRHGRSSDRADDDTDSRSSPASPLERRRASWSEQALRVRGGSRRPSRATRAGLTVWPSRSWRRAASSSGSFSARRSHAAFTGTTPRSSASHGSSFFVAALFQVLDVRNVVLRGSPAARRTRATGVRWGSRSPWTPRPTAALFCSGRSRACRGAGGWLGFLGETTPATLLFGRRLDKWRVAEALHGRRGSAFVPLGAGSAAPAPGGYAPNGMGAGPSSKGRSS